MIQLPISLAGDRAEPLPPQLRQLLELTETEIAREVSRATWDTNRALDRAPDPWSAFLTLSGQQRRRRRRRQVAGWVWGTYRLLLLGLADAPQTGRTVAAHLGQEADGPAGEVAVLVADQVITLAQTPRALANTVLRSLAEASPVELMAGVPQPPEGARHLSLLPPQRVGGA